MEINQIVADLKNKIDLRRELLKKRIDDKTQQLIDELNELKRTCFSNNTLIENFKSSSELSSLLVELENESAALKNELSLYERNEEIWKSIQSKCLSKLRGLESEYQQFKQTVFENRLVDFELKQEKYCLDESEPLL